MTLAKKEPAATAAKKTDKAAATDAAAKDAVAADGIAVPSKKKEVPEDDEFEDFIADEGWEQSADDDLTKWEDTWEDDDTGTDFAVLLKEEQSKMRI